MKLIKFDAINQYFCQVENYLLEDEAVNCLLLAGCLSLRNSDRHKSSYLALVEADRAISASAMQIGYIPIDRDRRL